jgi:hypothetical protein
MPAGSMSELPDHDRLREMLRRLEAIQQESVELRHRIQELRDASPEFPGSRLPSRIFDGIARASAEGEPDSFDE